MRFDTFDQLLNFRNNCVCGSPLIPIFNHSIHMDDDYTVIKPIGTYRIVDDALHMSCCLESRSSPAGEVNFTMIIDLKTSSCTLKSEYVLYADKIAYWHGAMLSADDFVKRHFSEQMQKALNINFMLKCSQHSSCQHDYQLSLSPLLFNMDVMKLNPLTIVKENFKLNGTHNTYFFKTDFENNITTITYNVPKAGYILGTQQIIEMNSDKFLRYPLEHEFLLNKLKTLLLFS